MLSFWEKQHFVQYDYVIVGSGIVGLSAAVSIKEANRKASVLILERGLFPTGASTKNAGFACFGSLTELVADLKEMGEVEMTALVHNRWLGLNKLRERLGDKALDYQNYGGYELISSKELKGFGQIDVINGILKPIFEGQVFFDKSHLIKELGFSQKVIKHLVYNPLEGQIDSGRMMKSLIAYASKLGVNIMTGATVRQLEEVGKGVSLEISNPYQVQTIQIKAAKTVVCTNAFVKQLLPAVQVTPGRGVVLVTKPLTKLPFKGTFHMDEGFFYFRNFEKRIIFGGGRNLDFEKETTEKFEVNETILANLYKKLEEIIMPGIPIEVDTVWTGIMGFGVGKKPLVCKLSSNIAVGVGMGGMGIALGSQVGEQLSQLIMGSE